MRRSAPSAGRLYVPLIVSAFAWLALAIPAAAASPTATPAASAPSATAGALGVTVVGSVDSSAYPSISAILSIVDAATGRPETALDASNVSLSPTAQVTTVKASTGSIPGAYVLAIDTSGSMADTAADGQTYMAHARTLAKAFAAGVGPDDLVKLVTFDETTVEKTSWLKRNDPNLGKAVDAVDYEARQTFVSAGLLAATKIANARPAGFDRRAVVVITDASPADNDTNLSSTTMRQALGPSTFVVGLLPPAKVGSTLSQLLSDVATYTGGSYQSADTTKDPATLFGPVWAITKSTWNVTFNTDPAPSGKTLDEKLTIHDAQGAAGTTTVTYQTGGLFGKSQINVAGLANGASVTRDQTVTISTAGYTAWKGGYQVQLFFDCDPQPQASKCSPILTANTATLTWPITVATMTQGKHHAYVRLAVTYNEVQYFSPTTTIDFTRSGTTWNIAAVILIGGIAVLLIGAFFIASRRRGAPRNQRRAQ
jgi:hypothetical protein